MTRESALRASRLLRAALENITATLATHLDQIAQHQEAIRARDKTIVDLLSEIDDLKERNQELEERLLKLDDIEEDDTVH